MGTRGSDVPHERVVLKTLRQPGDWFVLFRWLGIRVVKLLGGLFTIYIHIHICMTQINGWVVGTSCFTRPG